MMRQGPYGEGDWFAVPLKDGGFAAGVIARTVPETAGVLLGYFFGPRRKTVPSLRELTGLSASDALLVRRFGHLGLVQGSWPLIGRLGEWDPSAWPTPAFGRLEELRGRAFKVIYDDADPGKRIREEQIDRHELVSLPRDGLLGAGAVETVLTGLLRAGSAT
jgi:Immunity protein 26